MRIEPQGNGYWVIAMDQRPPRYFCIINRAGGWSKHKSLAELFATSDEADGKLKRLRAKAKAGRERDLSRKPKPLSEYCWTIADKRLLVEMFAIGCKPEAMAAQFNRTAAACRAMYYLILKRGTT